VFLCRNLTWEPQPRLLKCPLVPAPVNSECGRELQALLRFLRHDLHVGAPEQVTPPITHLPSNGGFGHAIFVFVNRDG
jgi:hypothetical protein